MVHAIVVLPPVLPPLKSQAREQQIEVTQLESETQDSNENNW